jgi:hypothetical protein
MFSFVVDLKGCRHGFLTEVSHEKHGNTETESGKMKNKTKRKVRATHRKPAKKWSARVTRTSDALDLEQSVFKKKSAKEIASSLKRSATRSTRKKGTPYQSAMSMLNFYINRAGKNLSPTRKKKLESAKIQLKKVFHKDDSK